jgi:D-lactate dehydrogenase
VASDIVNRCIECGFCESNCPSRDLTLTPRQRITVFRELARLKQMPDPSPQEKSRLSEMSAKYEYDGESTCAADGMCQEKCPVAINTGDLIKHIRASEVKSDPSSNKWAVWLASNFSTVNANVPRLLNTVNFMHGILGPSILSFSSRLLNRWTDHFVPVWNPYMPKGASPLNVPAPPPSASAHAIPRKVVYFPTCVTRMMGPSHSDYQNGTVASVHEKLMSIFTKAGYEVIVPKSIDSLCCGMMFSSKGFKDVTQGKAEELEAELLEVSEGGKYPIVFDTSPCLSQMKSSLSSGSKLKFSTYEPVEFIRTFLLDKLEFTKVKDVVAVHVPCSSKKMGIEESFNKVASLCAHEVVPSGIPCCGMAGDRGMKYPELTGSSLQHLNLPASCKDGYSTSRTCEVSLSNHSGIDFRGLVYLVDEATKAKKYSRA